MSVPVPLAASRLAVAAVLAAAGVACTACGGGGERPVKGEAPAVWCQPSTLAALSLGDLDRLREAGVREFFVEAARLDWGGGGAPELTVAAGLAAPRRLPATLVISGDWSPQPAFDDDPGGAAHRLGEKLHSLALAAESAGLLPVGFHFAPRLAAEPGALAGFAAVLGALRREVDRSLFVSADLEAGLLTDPDAVRLAGAVDFLVVFLYGRGPSAVDSADSAAERAKEASWDLAEAERGARAADALGRDFLVGVETLGDAVVLDAGGAPIGATTRASLGSLVADPALTVSRSPPLAGGSRQSTVFEAARATRVGGYQVRPRQRIRAERPSPGDLLELAARVAALRLEHLRGAVYYRLPSAEERLSLPVTALAQVFRGELPPPGLELTASRSPGGGRRSLVEVVLSNRGDLPTGVALLDYNYVELRVRGGAFGSVEPGRFRRYALETGGRDAANMRDLRNADTLKLFVPIVEAGESVASGAIEVRATGDGDPEVTAGGRFILASGQLHELPPAAVGR